MGALYDVAADLVELSCMASVSRAAGQARRQCRAPGKWRQTSRRSRSVDRRADAVAYRALPIAAPSRSSGRSGLRLVGWFASSPANTLRHPKRRRQRHEDQGKSVSTSARTAFTCSGSTRPARSCFSRQFTRSRLIAFFEQKAEERFDVAFEACSGAHWLAHQLVALGHDVRLLTPESVRPFAKAQKNDWNDALAIAEAARRPERHSVGIASRRNSSTSRRCTGYVKGW